jgi:hypothetical protein
MCTFRSFVARVGVTALALCLVSPGALLAGGGGVTINEVRIDQNGSDNDEYAELAGPAGFDLTGMFYIVVGDFPSGDIEEIVDLTGQIIPPSGYFVIGDTNYSLTTPDMVEPLNFENSDNVTHMLVTGLTAALSDNVDADADCVFDSPAPWTAIVDSVALVETPGSGDCYFGPNEVGPDGTFVPSHAYRLPDATGPFQIGYFDPLTSDTPGATNVEPPPINNDCAFAIDASCGGGAFPIDNTNASSSGINASDSNMGSDLWFVYTAGADGDLSVSTCLAGGSLEDTVIIIYDGTLGCPIAGDLGIADNDDDCSNVAGGSAFMSAVSLPVVAGTTYYIQVGGWNGDTGTSTLDVTFTGPAEICDDGVDNDADCLADCDDPDCATDAFCLPPVNDNCIDAIAVGEGGFAYNNTNGTLDGPTDGDSNMSADVWFLYTATVGGTATIDTCLGGDLAGGTLDDTVLIVYDGAAGCPIAGDAGLASSDDDCENAAGGSAFMSTVSVPVCAGDTLLVQVGGWNGEEGTGQLNISVAGPGNDDCASAEAIGEGQHAYSTCGATLDGPTDGDGNMAADVWFLYTASSTGNALIGTCLGGDLAGGTLDDTVIIAYDAATGCPVAGDLGLASNDDSCSNTAGGAAFMSEISLPVVAGSSYYIQVGGWNGAEGSGVLSVSLPETCDDGLDNDTDGLTDCADPDCVTDAFCIEAGNCADGLDNDGDGFTDCADDECLAEVACDGLPPANDNCLDAIAVTEGTTLWENLDATLDGPTDGDSNMGADVWFVYTPGCNGTATINTCNGIGTLDDTVLIIYDGTAGCPIAGDLGIASSDDACSLSGGSAFNSEVSIAVTAGTPYLIQAGGWNGDTGSAPLNISLAIDGDNCADAAIVGEGSFPFDNCGATLDGPVAGDSNMAADVWFLYTPTLSGDATIGTCLGGGALDDTVLIVYDGATGCPVGGDPGLAANDDDCENVAGGSAFMSQVTIPVTLGSTYYVQVGGWNGATGDGILTIDTVVPCVDPTPSFSAGPLLTGIAPLTVDFMNMSDDGGDPATTYSWDFGDGGSSTDMSPSHTYSSAGTFDVTLTANGCGATVPTTQAGLVTTYAMGDVNCDGSVDVADPIAIANYLFGGGPASCCGNLSDANGDGAINIADPVWMLGWLFSGGAAPVPPAGPGC